MVLDSLSGYSLATFIGLGVLYLPGFALAKCAESRFCGLKGVTPFAPALAFALLPVFDALLMLASGSVLLAGALRLILGAAGLAALVKGKIRIPSAIAVAAGVAWWLYVAVVYLDVDFEGRLYQSITVLDLVKHAAVVREIAQNGLPLIDPFFARSSPAAYYHYFYDAAAIIDVFGGSEVDSRMAFVGAAFWCGIAFATLLRAFVVELGWQRTTDKRLTLLVVGACALGGLDLVGILFRWLATGMLEPNAEWWDDEISFFTTSASWVPHHLAGVIAVFVAFVFVARAHEENAPRTKGILIALAGIAMASAFGLSIWVTIAASMVLLFSVRLMLADRPVQWFLILGVTGLVALTLSFAQIVSLLGAPHGSGGVPIGIWIREPARLGEVIGHAPSVGLSLVLTPWVWFLEFGVFALGSWIFWRHGNFSKDGALPRLLAGSAGVALLANLILRSMIINNDFGWRSAWLVEMPMMIWTVSALQSPVRSRAMRIVLCVAAVMGLCATLYSAIGMRIIRAPSARFQFAYINRDAALDHQLALAYRWADKNLPRDAIIQHDPLAAPRAFDFGLYGSHRVVVADGEATLFGANSADVRKSANFWHSVFTNKSVLPNTSGIYLMITDHEKIYHIIPAEDCIFRTERVCLRRDVAR